MFQMIFPGEAVQVQGALNFGFQHGRKGVVDIGDIRVGFLFDGGQALTTGVPSYTWKIASRKASTAKKSMPVAMPDVTALRATLRQAFDHASLKAEIRRLNQVTREQNFRLQDMNRNLEGMVRDRTKQLAEKHQELRVAYIQTIRALAEAVDAKDSHTFGHSERVGVYASKMARELGLPRELIERVYIAGLLHDVGKIGVPSNRANRAEPPISTRRDFARDFASGPG